MYNDIFKEEKNKCDILFSQEYENYKRFIQNNNMPAYNIGYIENIDDISYIMRTTTYTNPMSLMVNLGYILLSECKNFEPTLYHEFTHMWDSYNLFTNKNINDKKKVLFLYTEYHASIIEFYKFIKLENVNTKCKIEEYQKYPYWNKKYTPQEFLQDKIELVYEFSENYKKSKTPKSYIQLLQSIMYVWGTIDAYNNINDSNLSISLPRTIFDKYLKILHKVFKLNCLDDRVFDAILKLNKLLDNTFKSDV